MCIMCTNIPNNKNESLFLFSYLSTVATVYLFKKYSSVLKFTCASTIHDLRSMKI